MAPTYAWGKDGQSPIDMGNQSSSNTSSQPTKSGQDLSEQGTNTLARWLIALLRLCLFGALGVVIWLNIQPYIGMMTQLLGNQGRHPLVLFILGLPVIGWVLGLVRTVFLSILGILVWGLFQVMELMPSVMNSNSGIKKMIFGLSRQQHFTVNASDPPLLRQMKVRYNRKPQTWMRKAVLAASIAYLADLLFCLFYYPPIQGGMQNLTTFLLAPSADQIDVNNLALALVTLFSVEIAVWIFMWLLEGQNYLIGNEPRKQ